MDAILGNLRSAGFSIENAAHAFWLLDSYVYGQVIQETSFAVQHLDGDDRGDGSHPRADQHGRVPASRRDGRTRTQVREYSFDSEFDFGLALILDALENLHQESPVVHGQ